MSNAHPQSPLSQPLVLVAALLVGVGVLLLFAAAYYGQFYTNVTSSFGSTPEGVVTEFATKMKNVPLLASSTELAESMDEHYAPFVVPETLAAWKANPASAPGRFTSSPWPDRFELATSTKISETQYRVEGSIIEATSDSEDASDYSVVVTVVQHEGAWMIRSFERTAAPVGSPDVPAPMPSVSGTYVCLPHRDQSGPQTLECAFGIRTDDGTHYALDFSAYTTAEGMTIATGERIRVEGAITPVAALSDDQWRVYDIRGVIRVANITSL